MTFGLVTNTRGMTAPKARNWVSSINQNRAQDVQHMKERQVTKYGTMKFTSLSGSAKAVVGNSNNTITGANAPTNVFDKSTGVVPTYSSTYTPSYIVPAKVIVSGTIPATDKEFIQWKGTTQLVQIDGSVSLGPTDSNASVIRLQIHVNDKMVGPIKVNGANDQIPQSATVTPIKQFNSGDTSRQVQVSYRGYIDADDTIKLMIDRTDSTSSVDMTIFTATLTVKTLPMS